MPYLKIQTNANIDSSSEEVLLSKASTVISEQLGKPEKYVMISIEAAQPMLFAGTRELTAYLELKSIGLDESQTKPLSLALCQLINETLNIVSDRIYIEFADAKRSMWGWNSSTF